MRSAVLATLLLAAACSRAGDAEPDPQAPVAEPETPATAAAPADAAPAPAPAPAPAADCVVPMRGLFAVVGRMENAAEGYREYDKAVAAWSAVPEPCHGAEWHLLAARILRFQSGTLTAGAVSFDRADQALAAALALPPDADVLVMVAFVSGLGGAPALPADACERARKAVPGDARATYVCAHAGDAKLWLELDNPGQFPDRLYHRAEALAAAGKKAEARAEADRAIKLDAVAARAFGATDAEVAKLVDLAKALRKKL